MQRELFAVFGTEGEDRRKGLDICLQFWNIDSGRDKEGVELVPVLYDVLGGL